MWSRELFLIFFLLLMLHSGVSFYFLRHQTEIETIYVKGRDAQEDWPCDLPRETKIAVCKELLRSHVFSEVLQLVYNESYEREGHKFECERRPLWLVSRKYVKTERFQNFQQMIMCPVCSKYSKKCFSASSLEDVGREIFTRRTFNNDKRTEKMSFEEMVSSRETYDFESNQYMDANDKFITSRETYYTDAVERLTSGQQSSSIEQFGSEQRADSRQRGDSGQRLFSRKKYITGIPNLERYIADSLINSGYRFSSENRFDSSQQAIPEDEVLDDVSDFDIAQLVHAGHPEDLKPLPVLHKIQPSHDDKKISVVEKTEDIEPQIRTDHVNNPKIMVGSLSSAGTEGNVESPVHSLNESEQSVTERIRDLERKMFGDTSSEIHQNTNIEHLTPNVHHDAKLSAPHPKMVMKQLNHVDQQNDFVEKDDSLKNIKPKQEVVGEILSTKNDKDNDINQLVHDNRFNDERTIDIEPQTPTDYFNNSKIQVGSSPNAGIEEQTAAEGNVKSPSYFPDKSKSSGTEKITDLKGKMFDDITPEINQNTSIEDAAKISAPNPKMVIKQLNHADQHSNFVEKNENLKNIETEKEVVGKMMPTKIDRDNDINQPFHEDQFSDEKTADIEPQIQTNRFNNPKTRAGWPNANPENNAAVEGNVESSVHSPNESEQSITAQITDLKGKIFGNKTSEVDQSTDIEHLTHNVHHDTVKISAPQPKIVSKQLNHADQHSDFIDKDDSLKNVEPEQRIIGEIMPTENDKEADINQLHTNQPNDVGEKSDSVMKFEPEQKGLTTETLLAEKKPDTEQSLHTEEHVESGKKVDPQQHGIVSEKVGSINVDPEQYANPGEELEEYYFSIDPRTPQSIFLYTWFKRGGYFTIYMHLIRLETPILRPKKNSPKVENPFDMWKVPLHARPIDPYERYEFFNEVKKNKVPKAVKKSNRQVELTQFAGGN